MLTPLLFANARSPCLDTTQAAPSSHHATAIPDPVCILTNGCRGPCHDKDLGPVRLARVAARRWQQQRLDWRLAWVYVPTQPHGARHKARPAISKSTEILFLTGVLALRWHHPNPAKNNHFLQKIRPIIKRILEGQSFVVCAVFSFMVTLLTNANTKFEPMPKNLPEFQLARAKGWTICRQAHKQTDLERSAGLFQRATRQGGGCGTGMPM
ncbi:hypothetical protein PTTG_02030 [Puccinia triticina 1-1 BBBD Race 1]|uniref:Uncharacterized protein n=1 Tax=Puccinia triticina (isolate 1-1 / race 1 (BBBD)) TaxID=630390 RepID=A0A180GN08_PUCT1|nr:hypothetical protein PTTG_02030 [Puccinia triticina 1-1 BBBD Race 1]